MYIKQILILFIILTFCSCVGMKDVNREKTNKKIKLKEFVVETEKAKGDNVTVFLPYPLKSPERPKDITKTYKGNNGAKVNVDFDSLGVVKNINSDCPEIDKKSERNTELDYRLKTVEVERKLNIELADTIGKWFAITLIPIGFFFSVAFWLKR